MFLTQRHRARYAQSPHCPHCYDGSLPVCLRPPNVPDFIVPDCTPSSDKKTPKINVPKNKNPPFLTVFCLFLRLLGLLYFCLDFSPYAWNPPVVLTLLRLILTISGLFLSLSASLWSLFLLSALLSSFLLFVLVPIIVPPAAASCALRARRFALIARLEPSKRPLPLFVVRNDNSRATKFW